MSPAPARWSLAPVQDVDCVGGSDARRPRAITAPKAKAGVHRVTVFCVMHGLTMCRSASVGPTRSAPALNSGCWTTAA